MFYSLFKNILFKIDPENAHNLALHFAKMNPVLGKLTGVQPPPTLLTKVGGCSWYSPIGLAAGLDKNADALPFFEAQGFGALECGTVTLKPQEGNPRPRLWRYPETCSLRNAMGFPNQGFESISQKIRLSQLKIPLGINIGKNKETTPLESIKELSTLFQLLKEHADYLVINVSSPNTPGLRALQEKSYLSELFDELNSKRNKTDLYLKIAPDLSDEKIIELLELIEDKKLTGIIATNTTIKPELGTGGVSGELLSEKANHIRSLILSQKPNFEVIGVGGFSTSKQIFDFWQNGGKAIQVYTSYIYHGPDLLKRFYRDISLFLNMNQLNNLEEYFKLDITSRQKLNYPA